jgi:hypothetical protein
VYFDLKAIVEQVETIPYDKFGEKFREIVYGKILDKYVAESAVLLKEWRVFKIRMDEMFAEFREWVLDLVQHPLLTAGDWENAIDQEPVRQKYQSLNLRPHLNTLLLFLKEKSPLVLCFDNVDRHPISVQRHLLSLSIDISNGAQIPVILAIREPNLRRLISEDALGDILLADYLERLKSGEEKSILVKGMPDASIKALLKNRVGFLQDYEGFGTLAEFFEQARKETHLKFSEYIERFWGVFGILSQTFIDEDVYRYCNYNIREIMTHYFQLISKVLLNPEEEYSISKLIKDDESVRTTKLRNYFYKWLVCGENLTPITEGGLLNIFRFPPLKLPALDLRLIEFLYNWESKHPNDRLPFRLIAEEFRRFGVSPEIVKDHLSKLTANQGRHELGFVWLDKKSDGTFIPETNVELMPAGKYFLKSVSVSREYVFWNSLMADLNKDIVPVPRIMLSDTYKDEVKLGIVFRFIEQVLLPTLRKEMEYFDRNLQTPKDWDGSNWQYLRKVFSVDGYLYPYRLIKSVMSTISYSSISPDLKSEFGQRYTKLLAQVEEFEYL